MADYVVDTNVWARAAKPVRQLQDEAEIDCQLNALNWLKVFIESQDRLVLDSGYAILGEYRRQLAQPSAAQRWLNQLERQPRDRLVEYAIALDAEGAASLPPDVVIRDREDRKFVAVALAHGEPIPPLVNATDTDWTGEQAVLDACGIRLIELCEAYINKVWARRET